MRVIEIRHFGITVNDLHKAVQDFLDLGFIVWDKGQCVGKFAKDITGKKTKIEWVKMQCPSDKSLIELVKFTPDIDVKYHIALTVSDIEWFSRDYAEDNSGNKIKYVAYGDTVLEVVQ